MIRRRLAVAALAVTLVTSTLSACSSSDGYPLVVEFDKAVSLYESGSVKVLGLPAGTITDITVRGDHVRVSLRIDDGVKIPADVRATIVPQSLIGERYVQLFPAWTEGKPTLRPGSVIGRDRTSIPVEADEALEALKDFVDALDPDATGRLVSNLAADLKGNGQRLNDALAGLGQLAGTIAAKDEQLAGIIDHFDELMATVATREAQLARVLDNFAAMARVLAAERVAVQRLLDGLARLSRDGLDLVTEHKARLDVDLTVLTRTLQAVDVNLDRVLQVLDSGPLLVAGRRLDGSEGLAASYDPAYHHIDLRNSFGPTVGQAVGALGLPAICLPVDTRCTPLAPGGGSAAPAGAGAPTGPTGDGPAVEPGPVAPPAEPEGDPGGEAEIDPPDDDDDEVDLLAAGRGFDAPRRAPRRSWVSSLLHTVAGVVG